MDELEQIRRHRELYKASIAAISPTFFKTTIGRLYLEGAKASHRFWIQQALNHKPKLP